MGYRRWLAKAAAAFFPNRCLSCRQIVPADAVFCPTCETRYGKERQERHFSLHIRRGERRQLSCHAAGNYTGGLRQSMTRFKFHGKTVYARPFAMLMKRSGVDFTQYDVVTCVPMTDAARRKRGYNQSECLAKELGKLVSLPYEPLLKKMRENRKQRSLTKGERIQNVKSIYGPTGNITDRRILLVDDILTTGATISECATVLYRTGAKLVCGLCAVNTQEFRGT